MSNKKLRSVPDVVNAFIGEIQNDTELDPGAVEAIARLHREGKLTQTRLLQELEALRSGPPGNG